MTRGEVASRVQRTFANAGIDVQAWPWWVWIGVIIEHELSKLQATNA